MALLSMETAVVWVLGLVGFIAIFLGITVLSMKLSKKLSKPKR